MRSELESEIEVDAPPHDVHLAIIAGGVNVSFDNDISAKNKALDANSHIGSGFVHPRLASGNGVDHYVSAKAKVGREPNGNVRELVRFVAECDLFVARKSPQEAVAAPKCLKRSQDLKSPDRIALIAGIKPS